MPAGIVRETLSSALTPFLYVFERFSIRSSMLKDVIIFSPDLVNRYGVMIASSS